MIRPYGQRVAVTNAPMDDHVSGAARLVLPEGYGRMRRGVVIGVGDDVPHLTDGCLVFYPEGAGMELNALTILDAASVVAWDEP